KIGFRETRGARTHEEQREERGGPPSVDEALHAKAHRDVSTIRKCGDPSEPRWGRQCSKKYSLRREPAPDGPALTGNSPVEGSPLSMLSILTGHSYFLRFDRKQFERAKPYPPLATLQIAELLRSCGHEVTFFDAMLADGPRDYEQQLARATPQVAL